MNEWQDQPRLTAELRRLADEIDVNQNHKSRLRTRLTAQPVPDRTRRQHRRVTIGLLATAAAVALLAITLAMTQTLRRPFTVETGPAAPSPRSIPEANLLPVLELNRQTLCQIQPSTEPNPWEVPTPGSNGQAGARHEVGVDLVDDTSTLTDSAILVLLGDGTSWDANLPWMASTISQDVADVSIYVPHVVETSQAAAVANAILQASCTNAIYLVATSKNQAAAETVACSDETGNRFAGLAIIDPLRAPPRCGDMPPTLLFSSEPTEETSWQEWADAYRCESLSTNELDRDATKTAFRGCATPLVVITATSLDPADYASMTELLVPNLLELR